MSRDQIKPRKGQLFKQGDRAAGPNKQKRVQQDIVDPEVCKFSKLGQCHRDVRYQLNIQGKLGLDRCNPCMLKRQNNRFTTIQHWSKQMTLPQYELITYLSGQCKPFVVIGQLGLYSVNPYVGTKQHECFSFMGPLADVVDDFSSEEIIKRRSDVTNFTFQIEQTFSTSASLFEIKNHVLLQTVTAVDWDIICVKADLHNVRVYVHEFMALANIHDTHIQGIQVYIPNCVSTTTSMVDLSTKLIVVEEFSDVSEILKNIPSFSLKVSKPLTHNLMSQVNRFFKRNYMGRTYLQYNSESLQVTDDHLKWASYVIKSGNLDTPQLIVDWFHRLRTHVETKQGDSHYPYPHVIMKIDNMESEQQDEMLLALVRYVFVKNKQFLQVATALQQSLQEPGFLSRLFSVKCTEVVETRDPASVTIGNKPVPQQKLDSTIEVVESEIIKKPFGSGFTEIGPSINGFDRVIPSNCDEDTVINALECRQNAATIFGLYDINKGELDVSADSKLFKSQEWRSHVDKFEQQIVSSCSYTPISLDEAVQLQKGPKKVRYQKAYKSIVDNNMLLIPESFNTVRKSFIKLEALYKQKPEVPVTVAFRLIQAIDDKCTLALQTSVAPFSKQLQKLHTLDHELSKFVYVSGLDANDVGDLVFKAIQKCDQKLFIEMDYTTFDASQTQWAHQLDCSLIKKCRLVEDECASIADHLLNQQKNTIGYVTNFKTGMVVKYVTPYTRKSGDANTSCGNTTVNMSATKFVYDNLNLYQDLQLCLLLGDDNLSVLDVTPNNRKYFEDVHLLERVLMEQYKFLGLDVKVKVSKNLAHVEFCNMIFAPILVREAKKVCPSYTLIAKMGRMMSKFMKVKTTSLQGVSNQYYVDSNLIAVANTLSFYPGIKCFQERFSEALKRGVVSAVEADNQLLKTPVKIYEPDILRWKDMFYQRYHLTLDQCATGENLFSRYGGNSDGIQRDVQIPWFDRIASIDL